jgi:hypothetical protein
MKKIWSNVIYWNLHSRSAVNYAVVQNSYTLGGLVVSMLATGPTGHSVVGSNPTGWWIFMGDKYP